MRQRLNRLVRLVLAVAFGVAASGRAGFVGVPGRLEASDPAYQLGQLERAGCSDVGPFVRFDVLELVLDWQPPIVLEAYTCGCSDFDSVVLVYQRPDARPGAFDPAAPCSNLRASDDNGCNGVHSFALSEALLPGHVDVVVTSASPDVGLGRYAIFIESPAVDDFIFYSGFEGGDARTWSTVVDVPGR